MSTMTQTAANGLPQGELLRTLRALARKGAVARFTREADTVLLKVRNDASPRGAQLHEITNSAWQQALDARWITMTKQADGWRISRRGRNNLKRALTRKVTAPAPKQASGNSLPKPGSSASKPKVSDRSSPLAWLARRKDKAGDPFLSQHEIDAGERLSADFWFAQMTPRVTSSWNFENVSPQNHRVNCSADIADNTATAGERVRKALAAVGPDAADLLVEVCCHMKGLEALERAEGWPKRSAKIVLKFALGLLARHYGLTPPPHRNPRKVLHWGCEGYKPSISAITE